MIDISDLDICCRQFAGDDRAAVGRSIIDEDEFPVIERLVANTVHCLLEKAFLVEEIEHDRDQRHSDSL
jgi:hypothetical protein